MGPQHDPKDRSLVAEGTPSERSPRPSLVATSSPQYTDIVRARRSEIVRVRQKVRGLAQHESPEQNGVFEKIVNALIQYDKDIPTDPLSGLLAVFRIGKRVREVQEKKELYRRIVTSILEQVFDPDLEFRMTRKEVVDIFEANDIDRDRVARQQISQIYSRVLHNLKTGIIRDFILEEGLEGYIRLKLEDISDSREKWETDR